MANHGYIEQLNILLYIDNWQWWFRSKSKKCLDSVVFYNFIAHLWKCVVLVSLCYFP